MLQNRLVNEAVDAFILKRQTMGIANLGNVISGQDVYVMHAGGSNRATLSKGDSRKSVRLPEPTLITVVPDRNMRAWIASMLPSSLMLSVGIGGYNAFIRCLNCTPFRPRTSTKLYLPYPLLTSSISMRYLLRPSVKIRKPSFDHIQVYRLSGIIFSKRRR